MGLFSKWLGKRTAPEIKTALALGGGGIRGVAHLGVLKYLEERRYPPIDFLVGTSAGAVFGSLYLLSRDADDAINRLDLALKKLDKKKSLIHITSKKSNFLSNLKEKMYLAKSLFSLSVIDEAYLEEFLVTLIGENVRFSQLKNPLFVVATDLVSGKDVVFSKGDLIPALMASSAIPGAFPPQKYQGYCLIDGGSTQKLPAKIARQLGAGRIMAIDVGSQFQRKTEFSTSPQIISRSEAIASSILNRQNRLAADLLLTPEFKDMKWYDFHRHQEALEAGRTEARNKKNEIERFFNTRRHLQKRDISLTNDAFILDGLSADGSDRAD
jgi:NTE family protein